MNHSWNVYKIFNNGRRAKAPIIAFDSVDEESANLLFENNIIDTLSPKARQSKFAIVRSDLPQERQFESGFLEEQKRSKAKRKLFARLMKGKTTYEGPMEGGLLYSEDTGWEWQWSILTAANHRFVTAVSPKFKSGEEADKWMEHQLLLYGG